MISRKQFFNQISYSPHKGQQQIHAACERAKITVASCGVRFGKCVDGSTEIYDLSTGRRRRADEAGPLTVQSWDESLKSSPRPAEAFHSGRKRCVRLVLASGQRLELSGDHPVLSGEGWKDAALLEPGSLVATPRFLPEPESPLRVSDAELVFLGAMLTDGGTSGNWISFTQKPGEMLDQFENAVTALGGRLRRIKDSGAARQFSVLGLADLIRRWGLKGCKSSNKRLPAEFYGLASDQVGRLLSIMWACDGWFQTKGGIAAMTLSNRPLLEDVRHLLLRIGAHGRIRRSDKVCGNAPGGPKKCEAWTLAVTGAENLRQLTAALGRVPDKQHYVDALSDLPGKLGGRSDTDLVPVGREQIKIVQRELGLTSRTCRDAHFQCKGGYRLSRAKFKKGAEAVGYEGKLAHLADSDVLWSKVESVDSIGEREVYDLSVDADHNFAANNVIVHNTWGAAAEMAYNSQLPRPGNNPKHDFVGWCIGPTHQLADLVFDQTYQYLYDFLDGNVSRNKADGIIECVNLAGGRTRIMRRSTDQADGKKRHVGYPVDFMVIDEASAVSDMVWAKQLSTRLVDRAGRILMISSPEGRRGFFAEYFRMAAHDDTIIAVKLPTWLNPYIPREELLAIKGRTPALIFAQEYEGEFVAAEGQVFPEEMLEQIALMDFEEPNGEADYLASLDLAMGGRDRTVLIIGRPARPDDEVQLPRIVYAEAMHRLPIEAQIVRVGATLEAYGNAMCNVDATGMGDPVVSQMRNAGLPVRPVKFQYQNKREMVFNACSFVERKGILIPRPDVAPLLYDELGCYEWKQTPGGQLTAAAPEGAHDDTVAAFLLFCEWFPAAGTQGKSRFYGPLSDSNKLTREATKEIERMESDKKQGLRRTMVARGLADPNWKPRGAKPRGGYIPRRRGSGGMRGNSLFGPR